jgi:hypothetical protein
MHNVIVFVSLFPYTFLTLIRQLHTVQEAVWTQSKQKDNAT